MASQPRDKPGVYKTFPNQVNLRLSDDQEARVMRAAKARSKTRSDFIRDATMTLVDVVEEEIRARKREAEEKTNRAFVPRSPKSPRVFSFAFGKQEPQPQPDPLLVSSSQPTIIVQAPTAPAPVPDQIEVLTDYVLAAKNTIDREERGRIVEKIITSSTDSIEERKRIAKTLDDRIAVKAAIKAPQKSEEKKSVWSFLKR